MHQKRNKIYNMNTKYSKSKIMKLAHHLRKYEGYTMSQALTLAWSRARRNEFYLIVEVRKPKGTTTPMYMSAESVSTYYSSGAYSGD